MSVAAAIAGAGVLAAPTASATVTTLCRGYAGCLAAGMSDSGYGKVGKTMYWRMYGGHNCTNYAAYRMVRSGLPNTRPWTGSGNATNWGKAMSRLTNSTPAVGAVAWWKAGVKPAGSAGHVAYVERVVSADQIIVSMDSWHGDFSWALVTRTSSGWPSGFIHFNDVHLRTTVAPKIIGTAKVGSILTASPGTWTPAPTTLTYQWQGDGLAIPGATAATYVPTAAQVGKKLTVQVRASALGYPQAVAVSATTTPVQPGVLTSTSAPRINGHAQVGETLEAAPATWTPTPDHVGYQWLVDGVALPGATTTSLTLGPELVGKALSVTLTASKSGYPAAIATSTPTDPVAMGTLDMPSAPRIDGVPQPGQVLTVVLPSVEPATTVAVQWLRNGAPVTGATSHSYRLGGADLGARLLAEVRLTRAGYTPLTMRSDSTGSVRAVPVLRISAVPGLHRLAVSAAVVASGAPPVQGVLQIRSRGVVWRTAIHGGVARATLTHLPAGARTFRFRVVASPTLTTVMVSRRLTIR